MYRKRIRGARTRKIELSIREIESTSASVLNLAFSSLHILNPSPQLPFPGHDSALRSTSKAGLKRLWARAVGVGIVLFPNS